VAGAENAAPVMAASKVTKSDKEEDTIGVAIPWRDQDFIKKDPEVEKAEAEIAAKEAEKSSGAGGMRVGMALPNRGDAKSGSGAGANFGATGAGAPTAGTKYLAHEQEELELLESLLPKPELDFSKSRKTIAESPGEDMSIYRMPRTKAEKRRIAAMVTLLVGVAIGGAFYTKLIPVPNVRRWMAKKKTAAVVVEAGKNGSAGGAGNAEGNSAATSPLSAAASAPAAVASSVENPGAITPVTMDGVENSNGGSNGAADVSKEAGGEVKSDAAAGGEATKKAAARKKKSSGDAGNSSGKSSGKSAGKKKDKAETKEAVAANAPEPVASDAPIVPAKLLHWANPVYPPDAMLNYITGDVKVEAVVDSSGKVGAVKVISGPVPLRQAAMDALKQYEYAPATQGGRAVESRVTATVKFWYNP
jgi:TonB family protein